MPEERQNYKRMSPEGNPKEEDCNLKYKHLMTPRRHSRRQYQDGRVEKEGRYVQEVLPARMVTARGEVDFGSDGKPVAATRRSLSRADILKLRGCGYSFKGDDGEEVTGRE